MKLKPGEWLVLAGTLVIVAVAVAVGWTIYIQPPRVHYVYLDSKQARRGETIYRREGCNACHQILGNGYGYGPSLDGIGSRRTAHWLQRYLKAPWPGVSERRYRTEMPAYDGLAEEDLGALVAYLAALRQAAPEGGLVQP